MLDESFFLEVLIDLLVSLVGPAVLAISMFVLWRSFSRTGEGSSPAFRVLAKGFGYLFLSIALPFSIGLVALVLGDSADEISELWFSAPAALLTVVGTVYIMLGTRQLARQAASGG